ncbi:MAG TPA: glycosyltransferase family 39 protein, partial [Anaerolineae bacterium]
MIPSRLNEPRFTRILIGGLLAVFFILCIAYNLALPLFEAPDEGAHYIYVDYIASHRQLPDLEHMLSHEVSQTPLYYMIGAPMIAWIDRSDYTEVFRIEPGLNNGIVNAHTPAEHAFPPTGVTLAVRILRLYSSLLGALTVLLIYATVNTLFVRRDVALVALAVTAFNPKFLHMSSQFNNDIALACTSALCVWIAVRMLKQYTSPTWKQWLALGASVGMAVAVKLSGFVMAATVAFTVVWWAMKSRRTFDGNGPSSIGLSQLTAGRGPRQRTGLLQILLHLSLWCILGFVLSCGWMIVYYTLRFGNPLPLFLDAHALGIRPIPLSLTEILARMPTVLTSYWGEFGHGVQFPMIVDQVMLAVAATSAIGVVIALIKRQLPGELAMLVV